MELSLLTIIYTSEYAMNIFIIFNGLKVFVSPLLNNSNRTFCNKDMLRLNFKALSLNINTEPYSDSFKLSQK